MAIDLIVTFLGACLLHYYVWRRLVRNTTRPGGRGRRIGTALIMLAVLVLTSALVFASIDPDLHALAMVGYLWLAVLFYLIIVLVVLEIPAFFARRAAGRAAPDSGAVAVGVPAAGDARTSSNEPESTAARTTRRLFVARSVAATAGLVSVATVGYGMTQALGAPRLKRRAITLAKLPRAMDGYRVALVSDIHLGPISGHAHTQRIVDTINRLDADIVAVVGDLVDGSVAQLGHAAEPLRGLRSRDGAFFVTGNHEYYSGYEEWITEVAELGMRPLRNERIALPGGLDLAGVNDRTGGAYGDAPDYAKALADRDPAKAVILLAHQPVQVREAAKYGVDLQLSGHTHGGQLAPFNYVVKLQQPVVSGYDTIDGTQIYVTNGAGFWGPPVRVGAPPDITLIELRSA
ncbi:metallophosphoesterase [Hamadaea tsunoensis]|uniref:metallophosphoesterase n=1 Tax=Hamadaea tsunoensis TaxID=53368 RepID=UPI000687A47C|nr:metallophosphoesterase [Hamadaea tsunoensis]